MLCVCCLALAACGGGAASSASSAASSSSASAADPADQFVGTWKFAAAETQGVTMSGDLSTLLGTDTGMEFTFEAGGTGNAAFAGETAAITWEVTGDNGITIKAADTAASSDAAASSEAASASSAAAEATELDADNLFATGKLEDGALKLETGDGTESVTMIFTQDGTYAGAKTIDTSAATPITSADALVGSYTLTGLKMMGISMYGDPAALSAVAGDTDTTLTFDADGKVSIMGSAATYAATADGAAITISSVEIPVQALDDGIAVDMSSVFGAEMIMVFSK